GGPGQPDDTVLAGGVGGMPPGATQPHDRCVVDDRASARSQQLGDLIFHTEEDALEVDAQDAVPTLLGALCEGPMLLVDARVVEGTVQAAERGNGGGNERLHVRRTRDVCADEPSLASSRMDETCGLFAAGCV